MPLLGFFLPAPAATTAPAALIPPDPMRGSFMMLHLGIGAPIAALVAWLIFGSVIGAAAAARPNDPRTPRRLAVWRYRDRHAPGGWLRRASPQCRTGRLFRHRYPDTCHRARAGPTAGHRLLQHPRAWTSIRINAGTACPSLRGLRLLAEGRRDDRLRRRPNDSGQSWRSRVHSYPGSPLPHQLRRSSAERRPRSLDRRLGWCGVPDLISTHWPRQAFAPSRAGCFDRCRHPRDIQSVVQRLGLPVCPCGVSARRSHAPPDIFAGV